MAARAGSSMESFRILAKDLSRIDLEVYRQWDRDPLEPLIGTGDPNARLAIFGRDPGREEVRHWLPFIGAGGQQVRKVLYRCFYRAELPDFAGSVTIGDYVFWLNTVPYKPLGNKVWPKRTQRLFRPLMRAVLLDQWCGSDILTLGRDAFFWFAIDEDKSLRDRLTAHWARPDRFETSLTIDWADTEGSRSLTLHPLPHPSPLNAVWYRQFPDLLETRLKQLDWQDQSWRLKS